MTNAAAIARAISIARACASNEGMVVVSKARTRNAIRNDYGQKDKRLLIDENRLRVLNPDRFTSF
jgi:hypothetical protein